MGSKMRRSHPEGDRNWNERLQPVSFRFQKTSNHECGNVSGLMGVGRVEEDGNMFFGRQSENIGTDWFNPETNLFSFVCNMSSELNAFISFSRQRGLYVTEIMMFI